MIKLFFSYLELHLKLIIMLLLFAAATGAIFALYGIPFSPVLYAYLVCFFVGLATLALGFFRFVKKHRRLDAFSKEIAFTDKPLPEPSGLIEKDYNSIIRALYSDRAETINRAERKYSDLVEYYTVWAHQIKTPIAAMNLLLRENDSDENRELLDNLQRIEQYVEMVLCYLRLDGETNDLVIRRYSLDEIIRQCVRKYASQFIRKKIRLEYSPVEASVLTDEKWLSFIIEQLLSNSLKYTKTGSVKITLESPKTLVISDSGIGIAPEDLPRVFEKGYTGYNGRSDKKATGIGLFLCRKIADKLGHKISIESAVGAGTTVRLDLSEYELKVE